MPKKLRGLKDLSFDDRNANKGTKRGSKVLNHSLLKLGAGRSILVDREGRVIAGNKTLAAARSAKLKGARIIQTQGDELIVVQRTDLDLKRDPRARELAVADNRASELGLQWDDDVLHELAADCDFSELFNEMEIEPKYVAVSLERMADMGLKPDLLETPKTA
jgi:hypothetical protein